MNLTPYATRYNDLGLHPIPVEAKGKRPLVEWKKYQTTPPTEDEIDNWFTNCESNIGVVLGRGLIAVDLDGGKEAEKLLLNAGIILPENAPRSRTGNGYHVFLKVSEQIGDSVGLLSNNGSKPQVDIRGVGFVVAAPSIHPNGRSYEWVIPPEDGFPDAPLSLLELIAKKHSKPGKSSPIGWVEEALSTGAKEGSRNDTCARLAGYFLQKKIDPSTVRQILSTSFALRCNPKMSENEIRTVVESISRAESINGSADRDLVPRHISEVGDDLFEQLCSPAPRVTSTDFKELDIILGGGFQPGELIYLGARPGVGKTAFALQIAAKTAKSGNPVLMVSREMSNTALVRRMVAQTGKIEAWKLKKCRFEGMNKQNAADAIGELAKLPILFTDEIVSIGEIASMVEKCREHELKLLIVDHLQLIKSNQQMKDKRLQVEAVSAGLKTIAMQYKIPVLCMSTLSRAPDKDKNAIPTMSSLRESGELEHDADIILLLHRIYGQSMAQCIIAKNRDGGIGEVNLCFMDKYISFDIAEGNNGMD